MRRVSVTEKRNSAVDDRLIAEFRFLIWQLLQIAASLNYVLTAGRPNPTGG